MKEDKAEYPLRDSRIFSRPVFIFAHPDDAVLSAFFALTQAKGKGLDIIICGGKPPENKLGAWDKKCGFLTSFQAYNTRIKEHQKVCKKLKLQSLTHSILDGQYCLNNQIPGKLARNIVAQLLDFRVTTIFTHFLYSIHPDHQKVSRLAVKIGKLLKTPVIHTCDRPYFDCTEKCSTSNIDSVYLPIELWENKKYFISLYSSQSSAMKAAFGKNWHVSEGLRFECYHFNK